MPDLSRLFHAESVAVIGASPKAGNFGRSAIENLAAAGFAGEVFAVHPGGESVAGRLGYRTVADLPDDVDCAVVALGSPRVVSAIDEIAARGIRAAVVFADPNVGADRDPGIEEKVSALCREADIAMLGMNGMGFYSTHHQLVVTGYGTPTDLTAGGISLISHSGTVFDSLTHSPRLAFNIAVSGGNESVVTEADYLGFAIDDPHTAVVGLYLETVRQPDRFIDALTRAHQAGIPVVALKVGTTERGAQMAEAHTGALAGGPEAYAAVLRRYGVHQVRDLDEMTNTLHLLSTAERKPDGGVAVVMDSGGERSLVTDLASEEGLALPPLSDATAATLRRGLEEGMTPDNPLDPFGSAHLIGQNFTVAFEALDADPAIDVLVLAADFQRDAGYPLTYVEALESLDLRSVLVTLLNLPEVHHPGAVERLRSHGSAVLHGTRSGLAALRHLVSAEVPTWTPTWVGRPPDPLVDDWKRRLSTAGGPLDEAASKRLLTAYGIPIPAGGKAADLDEALAIASQIGYPVVAKTVGVTHKTEAGGVIVDVSGDDQLAEAHDGLAALGEHVLIERMVGHDHELIVGATRDEQFGPLIVLGMGGVYTEILDDATAGLAPLSAGEAAGLARGLRAAPVLQGARGGPVASLDAIIDVVLRLATLAADFRDEIAEIDVNPLAVRTDSAIALDALVIPR